MKACTLPGPPPASRSDQSRDFAAVATGALLLLAVAFYNGYPLLYWDSSSHIFVAVSRVIYWARSPAYSVAILPLHLGVTLWTVAAAQAVVVAWLLHRVAAAVLGPVGLPAYLFILAVMSSCTSLPWFVGQVMPDVFVGVTLMGLFVLAFGTAGKAERFAVLAVTSFAVSAHHSHLVLAAVVACAITAASYLPAPMSLGPPRRALTVAVPLLGALLIVVANAYCGNRFDVTPPWNSRQQKEQVWQFASFSYPVLAPYGAILPLVGLLVDGPARDYLARDCHAQPYRLCEYLDGMPTSRDEMVWDAESPLYRAGGVGALRTEARTIVLRTVAAYPARCLRLAFEATLRQLAANDIGDGLVPFDEADEGGGRWVAIAIRDILPGDRLAFLGARQNTGTLIVPQVRRVMRAALALGIGLAAVVFVLAAHQRQGRLLTLGVVLFAGLLVHATVVSTGSTVAARFGARIVWVVPFYALLGLVWIVRLARLRRR